MTQYYPLQDLTQETELSGNTSKTNLEPIKSSLPVLKNLTIATIGLFVGLGLALASFRLGQNDTSNEATTTLSFIGRDTRLRVEELKLIKCFSKLLPDWLRASSLPIKTLGLSRPRRVIEHGAVYYQVGAKCCKRLELTSLFIRRTGVHTTSVTGSRNRWFGLCTSTAMSGESAVSGLTSLH